MTNAQKRIVRTYRREIKSLFPVFSKNEKRFLNDINNMIENLTNENEEFTSESLIQHIGEPKDIVSNYLSEIDSDTLRKSLCRTKYIRMAVAAIIISIFAAGSFRIYTDYVFLQEMRQSIIGHENMTIEQYDSSFEPDK